MTGMKRYTLVFFAGGDASIFPKNESEKETEPFDSQGEISVLLTSVVDSVNETGDKNEQLVTQQEIEKDMNYESSGKEFGKRKGNNHGSESQESQVDINTSDVVDHVQSRPRNELNNIGLAQQWETEGSRNGSQNVEVNINMKVKEEDMDNRCDMLKHGTESVPDAGNNRLGENAGQIDGELAMKRQASEELGSTCSKRMKTENLKTPVNVTAKGRLYVLLPCSVIEKNK